MEQNFRAIGSARSEQFKIDISPWLKEPLECVTTTGKKSVTVLKPAQSGGSHIGEGCICYWIANSTGGDIQYNWENDEKSVQRYKQRVRKILYGCGPVRKLWPTGRSDEEHAMLIFPHLNFTMQGIYARNNTESDSIRYQVNEELHGWEPGRLQLLDQRLTAFWNSFQVNISTGSIVGDQFHQRWNESSKRLWLEQCPACGAWQYFHVGKKKGTLGGLCYPAECKNADGTYDYELMNRTIYYECEACGHHMMDDVEERRQRSLKGHYEAREGNPEHEGYRWSRVSVYWSRWADIIKTRNIAINALKFGNKDPYIMYVQRVEADFWDPLNRPLINSVPVVDGLKKNIGWTEGLSVRIMTVDKQAGKTKYDEAPHYKVIIRDWKPNLDSRLVWEGSVLTDEELDELREKYSVYPEYVIVDSGHRSVDVYQMCARFEYSAIKGTENQSFPHILPSGEKVSRIYAPLQRKDPFIGDPSGRQGKRSIKFILYSKQSIRDTLDYIRKNTKWEVPDDVSDQYIKEMDAEEIRIKYTKNGEPKPEWCEIIPGAPNDFFVCECYQALFVQVLVDVGGYFTESINVEDREVASA
jgi:hypothetical protein